MIKNTVEILSKTDIANGSYFGAGIGYFWFWENFNWSISSRYINSSIPKEDKKIENGVTSTIKRDSFAGSDSLLEIAVGYTF